MYTLIAGAAISFAVFWVYQRMLKPLIIQKQVRKMIESFEKENGRWESVSGDWQ